MEELHLDSLQPSKDSTSQQQDGVIGQEQEVEKEKLERPGWDNKIQFLLATIGFAVGLGNVWRFPWLCQKNGGGAFLIPYFIMLIFEGIPIFFLELSIGQRMRQGSIQVWSTISPYMGGVGIASTVVCLLVTSYYNVVVSWVLFYFVKSFQSPLPWKECPTIKDGSMTSVPQECSASSPTVYFFHRTALKHSNSITSTPEMNWNLVISLAVGWGLVYLCVLKGIKSSGKVVYFTATFPYIVLFAFFIRGLLLEGYDFGIRHLFTPKWERLKDPLVWLDAATQIFFSLGLAFGTMIAYASYNPPRGNTLRDAVTVSLANCMTSLFASVVVFSILGFRATILMKKCEEKRSLGIDSLNSTVNVSLSSINTTGMSTAQMNQLKLNVTATAMNALPKCDKEKFIAEAAGGPGLVFIAFTDAINEMPGSNFWSVIFFFMLFTLALDSLFGALESVTTALQDVKGFKNLRKEVLSLLLCLCPFVVGLAMVTSVGEYVLQMFDSFCANLPLLLIALMECVGVCFFYGIDRFSDDIKDMTGRPPGMFWKACWMFITPVAMTAIVIATIVLMAQGQASYFAWNETTATYEKVPYPTWAVFVNVLLILASTLFIPIVAFIRSGLLPNTKTVKISTVKDSNAAYINKAM